MTIVSLSCRMKNNPVFKVRYEALIAAAFIVMALFISDSGAEIASSDAAGSIVKEFSQSSHGINSSNASMVLAPDKTDQPQAVSSTHCRYTIKVGEYVIDKEVSGELLRVRALGLEPGSMSGPRRKTRMIRLAVGEFKSKAEAEKALAGLKNSRVDGLVMRGGDKKYRILLSSYADQKSAENEQAKLAAMGIRVNMHRQVVPVPTKILTAGTFKTRDEAMKSAWRLKYLGLKCYLQEI
jgi:cell division septation protein DedD